MLKDKLRHIKIFKSFFKQKSTQMGQDQPEIVKNTLPTEAKGDFYKEETVANKEVFWLVIASVVPLLGEA